MKKIIICILIFCFAFLVGCNAKNENLQTSSKAIVNTTETSLKITTKATHKKTNKKYSTVKTTNKTTKKATNKTTNNLKSDNTYDDMYNDDTYLIDESNLKSTPYDEDWTFSKDYSNVFSPPENRVKCVKEIFEKESKLKTSEENPMYKYIDYKSGIAIIKYSGNESVVNVPQTLDGKTVVAIGSLKNEYNGYDSITFLNKNISKIILPKTLNTIDEKSLISSSANYFEIEEGNDFFTSINGIIFTKDKKNLLFVPKKFENKKEYKVPEKTECIWYSAEFLNFKNIVIPKSLKYYESTSLLTSNITIDKKNKYFSSPNKNSICSKDGKILYSVCGANKSYIMPNSINYISEYAFFGSKFKTIKINKNLKNFDFYAFIWCENLKKVSVNNKNKILKSKDNVLFSFDEKILICYPNKRVAKNNEYVVPSSVEYIPFLTLETLANRKITLTIGKNIKKFYINKSAAEDNGYSFTIKGYRGTAAEKLAEFCDIKFIPIA